LPEEGEEVIKTILSLYPDHLELVEIRGFFNEGFMKGTIRSWPHIHNTSGMFFALLEKVDSLK
ncbi:MAG: Fmu (Sun) domain-containing protein, partial [Thermoprotei archaeon]